MRLDIWPLLKLRRPLLAGAVILISAPLIICQAFILYFIYIQTVSYQISSAKVLSRQLGLLLACFKIEWRFSFV